MARRFGEVPILRAEDDRQPPRATNRSSKKRSRSLPLLP